jgi:hypothetical protein
VLLGVVAPGEVSWAELTITRKGRALTSGLLPQPCSAPRAVGHATATAAHTAMTATFASTKSANGE